jgi:xylulokinase
MIGIDIGSGGCKVAIVSENGRVTGSAYQEYPTYYPHPGWSEQTPQEWFGALQCTVGEALKRACLSPSDIASVAVGAATHTLVLLDRHQEVLRPAILWRDKRTIAQVEWLRDRHGEEIYSETLHTANVNWTLPYLMWIREAEPEVWRKAATILMPKDYIRYRLTGVLATDWMDAHGTLMFNVRRREWSQRICRMAGIPSGLLPPVFPPEKVVGGITRAAALQLGLREGTPVVTGTTDQAAEAFGAGAIRPGQGILKMATAGNVAVVTDEPHPSPPRVYAYYHMIPSYWYTLAGTISCAVCYRWMRDALCQEEITAAQRRVVDAYELMDRLAETAPVGCEGLIFHPHLQGAIFNPYLRGDFIGITSRHNKAYFLRAVLEGVAFSLLSCVREHERLGVRVDDFRIIGGGAKSPLWRQITCDVVGKEMIRPAVDDSSFGTALVGGLGVGIFSSVEDAVRRCVRYVDVVKPDPDRHAIYRGLFEVYQQLCGDLDGAYRRLHGVLEGRSG